MFNEVVNQKRLSGIGKKAGLTDLFSEEILSEIKKVKENQKDNLIIHGLPVPASLPDTPQEIRGVPKDTFPSRVLRGIGSYLGTISEKDVENTIRFRSSSEGVTNEETWHGHYQYRYSVFYCLRGDKEAKTYLLSANELIVSAPNEIKEILLTPLIFSSDTPPFALIEEKNMGYKFSPQIYGRSELEKQIKDLDLPDVIKALQKLKVSAVDSDAMNALDHLFSRVQENNVYASYVPGDIALYNEQSTIRYSPPYIPSTSKEEDRWLLSLSVE